MSAIQLFCLVSTSMFILLGVMLNTQNTVGLVLKAICWILAVFGTFVSMAVFGVVLASGIRLV